MMDLILLSGYSTLFLISSIVGTLSSAYLLTLGSPLVIFFHGIIISVTSQKVLIVFTEFLKVPPVIFFLSTRSFSDRMNFKMELKAQFGFCFPFSTNRLHLFSNVGPSSEIASKNLRKLLKYDSLVCGDRNEYTNIVYGSASVSFCSSNCVNSYLSYLPSPIRELLEVRVRWDSDPRHFNPIKTG